MISIVCRLKTYNIALVRAKGSNCASFAFIFGVKNIHIGPTLPGLSPAILKILVDSFGIAGIGNPEDDIELLIRKWLERVRYSLWKKIDLSYLMMEALFVYVEPILEQIANHGCEWTMLEYVFWTMDSERWFSSSFISGLCKSWSKSSCTQKLKNYQKRQISSWY